ncbi:MAG: DNA/RNA non-specific endonuclease [Bacteroides sp.]|nr:DNA/RNA non-specific endonuclease [Bacteroides sp.]
MAKRKKRKNKKNNQIKELAALVISAGTVFLGGGTINSCSTIDELGHLGNSSETDSSDIAHYSDLETVTIPKTLPSQIKEYLGFTVSFNKDNKTPNYVAWELLGEEVTGDQERSNNFWTDSEIDGCPSTKDYTRSGYDRGHMCPAADQKWSTQAMSDCFVMTNICPQLHELNAGAWSTLENKERQWARRDSAIMIISGPIYDKTDTKTIGDAKVRVPSAFFKVLLAPYIDQPRGIAFVYPNISSPGNMQDYAMSIDELEKLLGYDFFPALPDEIENKVEATFSFKEWNSSK